MPLQPIPPTSPPPPARRTTGAARRSTQPKQPKAAAAAPTSNLEEPLQLPARIRTRLPNDGGIRFGTLHWIHDTDNAKKSATSALVTVDDDADPIIYTSLTTSANRLRHTSTVNGVLVRAPSLDAVFASY